MKHRHCIDEHNLKGFNLVVLRKDYASYVKVTENDYKVSTNLNAKV